MIRRTYAIAGISDLSQTPYIECHGTGTAVGDPAETSAVANVFSERGIYIGSVKPNVGHSEGASGLTSLIKAVLALEKGVIPPNINFRTPNPKIPFKRGRLQVPVEATPWPQDRHARVSVNSFGIGGTNAHVIIESAASLGMGGIVNRNYHDADVEGGAHGHNAGRANGHANGQANGHANWHMNGHANGHTNGHANGHTNGHTNGLVNELDNGHTTGHQNGHQNGHTNGHTNGDVALSTEHVLPVLVPASAASASSLASRVKALQHYFESRSAPLDQVAYTLGNRRQHQSQRAFFVAGDHGKLLALEQSTRANPSVPHVVFVFTGQGAQWFGMGKELIQKSQYFQSDVRRMDEALRSIDPPPCWSIRDILCSQESEELIQEAEYCQPLCTALQVALVSMLSKCGVAPEAVVGHSSGEIAAAFAAGALTMTEAILCAYYRGLASRIQTQKGSMAAVGLGRDAVFPLLADGAVIACENSANSITLSGDVEAIQKTLERIKSENPAAFTRKLPLDKAYHSHHMNETGRIYEEMLSKTGMSPKEPKIPLYSSLTGRRAGPDTRFDQAYWRQNLESPVLFKAAVQALLSDFDVQQEVLMLEIGPHGALRGPLTQICASRGSQKATYTPTLHRGNDCYVATLTALGRMYAQGCSINFDFLNPTTTILTDVPRYSWDHRLEFWAENRISQAWREKREPHHELLGSRCLECSDIDVSWRNVLQVSDVPWLLDHKLMGDNIFPCAGYLAILGEAIRQTTGSSSYMLRNVVINAALKLHESETIELMTTMRPLRLTDTENSSWFEFSIMSYSRGCWAQHCVAQGKAGQDHTPHGSVPEHHPRWVNRDTWYGRMGKMGLHYGPFFHGLQRISSHTTEDKAVADIETDLFPHLGQYAVHPTMLDACLQLLLVSTARGVSRHLLGLSVPATLGSVSIGPFLASTRLRAEAASRTGPRGVVDGHVMAVSGAGEIVVKVEKVIVKPMDSDSKDDSAHNAQARLEWRPDIDFIDGSQMFRRITSKRDAKLWLERVCALCILRALDGLQSVDIPSGHLAKYATWLQNEKGRMLADEWANLVPEARQWAELEPKTRATVMASVTDEIERVENIATRSFARLALKVSDPSNIRDVFRERIKPVELLMDDGALEVTYGFYNDMVDMENIVALSAHSQPTMRVLEIGAGTGACTEFVLKSLKSEEGTRMYSLYTFTDISSGFFAAAQNKFKQHDGINYKVFDVTRSPAEQGLELGSYDLVVVNNVLHATASLRESLKNVRLLLRPGGRLILVELAQPMMWRCTGQIMGLLPGWWVGEGDNRPDEPFVSPKRWNEELEATGFSGTDVVVLDDDSPYQLNAYIASTAVQPIESVASAADVTLLYAAFKHEFACQLAARLTQDGTRVHWSQIGAKDHVVGRHVISTIDLESPYLHDITKADYDALLAYVTTTKSDMLWLTRAAQIQSLDPRYGLTIGFARTIRTELALRFSTLELQNLDSGAVEATIAVFLKCQRYSASADFDAEPEFVLHNGIVHIGRYRSIRPRDESQVLSSSKGRSRRLVIGQYGLIDSLRWVQDQPPMLEAHEVELDVRAVGLNFRDVLTTMGIIEGWKHNVGIEASAVVTRVGSAVNHVKAGDRVVAAHRSCFSTRIVIPGLHVCRIPDELGFEDAATMPAVYTTVIHCIINMGQLARGQSILIQSACGGVGLAALQICEMIGAEIYVTVGSEDKVRYLMDHHGIPRERIFSSRNTSFLEGIMRATNGRGVDMVLNSLSGELLHAAWQCVAKYGKMMEIGKRDFVGHGKLDLNPFDANRVFHGIDLAAILQDRPHTFHQLLEQCVQLYTEGHIKPIRPVQIFPAREAVEAFRCMQKGRHIGKLVVRMPVGDEARRITTVASLREPALSSEHSYFLAGGLGGLGKAITTWMIERGARHFVFLSRSAGKTVDDQDFLRELASQGCQAVAVAGSVAEPADVQRAVQAATTPIAGVVHMPLVLKDASLPQMEHAAWVDVIGPKVNGAWNIHNALAHSKLDFFVLFSSLSAAWGHPGQANYASANSFLESFAQYRRGLDLPCSVISLGFMENIGYVSRNIKASNQVRNMVCLLQEEELIDALNISINQSWPPSESAEESQGRYCNLGQIMVGMRSTKPLSDPGNHVPWRRDVRMSLCHRQESAAERSTDLQSGHLRVLLDLIASNKSVLGEPETLKVITREIGKALCNFTMSAEENLDVTTSLVSLGIDSLLGIEVRNWWRRTFGADITVIEIMVARTVENLGIMALDSLKERFGYEKE